MISNPLVLGSVFLPLFGAVLTLFLVRHNWLQRYVSFGVSLAAFACSLALLIIVTDTGAEIYRMGHWDAPYGIVLVADKLSAIFVFMSNTVMMLGVLYAVHFKDKCGSYPAFFPLFLMMQTGLAGATLTGDLFTFFVFMELMVLSSVSMVSFSDDRLGVEAAIKYLLISGMGTLLLLFGVASLYASLGTLNMADMAQLLKDGERPLLAQSAGIMLTLAFLLKSAVFPFHFWLPDFHTTAPTPVSSTLSSVVVKVGVYGILRLNTLLFTVEAERLGNILIVLGIVGIFFGSLGALKTYNGKRMLAYSTIGQIGFILVAVGWGHPAALVAAIVYAFNHAFIKSALLMLMGVVASYTQTKTAAFAAIGGVGKLIPGAIGALWILGGMALAGIPPLNGFISKYMIVRAGVSAEEWLALGLVVGSGVLTLIYMMRSWQYVFQQKVDKDAMAVKIKPYGDSFLAPLILLGICVLLGLYARPVIVIAQQAVAAIGDPTIYIDAVQLARGL